MKKGVVVFWSVCVGLVLFRLWQSFHVSVPNMDTCIKEIVKGSGTISSEPERKATGQVLIVDVSSMQVADGSLFCPSDFLLRVKTALYPAFTFGTTVSFSGKILVPMNFQNGDRTFDYRGYLAKDDVYYEMRSAVVKNAADSSYVRRGFFDQLTMALYALKSAFEKSLNRVLGEPHASLAAGLVVGEKAALGKDLLDDFRTVGLIHVVVLSGFNITIVADAMRKLLSFLPRVWGIVIGGIGILLFGVLVGGGATVVRSCFMASIALSADLLRRDYNVLRALTLAGLIMLIQNPMILLHDASFELSFLATLGLVLLAKPIEKKLGMIPDRFGLRGIVATTLATQIFVSPFILYLMGQISLIGVFVNILVLPCIPATMLFVFLTGASGLIWYPLSQFFGWVSHILLSYELFMVEHGARVPFATLHVALFSAWWVAAFYAIVTIAYLFFRRSSL